VRTAGGDVAHAVELLQFVGRSVKSCEDACFVGAAQSESRVLAVCANWNMYVCMYMYVCVFVCMYMYVCSMHVCMHYFIAVSMLISLVMHLEATHNSVASFRQVYSMPMCQSTWLCYLAP
jgi:hypothetical protein